MEESNIQALALCIFRNKENILVKEGFDDHTSSYYYRPLGGKMSFGEYSWEALRREIRTEIGEDIKNLSFIGPAENIYKQNGSTEHELIFMFEGEFVNRSVYKKDKIQLSIHNGTESYAIWKPLEDFISKQSLLYPDGLLEILTDK